MNGRLPLHFAARVSSSAFSPDADKEKDTLADADALADSARGFALLTCSNPLCTICKRMHLMRLAAILPLPAHLLARIVADPRWCALRSSVSLFYALSSTVHDYLLSPHPMIPGFVSSEYSVFFEY